MPVTEIIAIGTELLLGEIQDTNTRAIARRLRDYGVDVFRASLVGDNPHRIAQAISDSAQRSQIIITTGGLGPTVDDPTRQAVAEAAGVELDFRPELWEQIQARFERMNRTATENNRRQAYIPTGSLAVPNPVGTAPSFICTLPNGTIVISLPGVPKEMEYLFENEVLPFLQKKFKLHEIILARVLHVSGMGESVLDEIIGDLEEQANPTVGLAAHTGQVDIRITAKAEDEPTARKMIQATEQIIRQRIPKGIYGVDADTMEKVAAQRLFSAGWTLEVLHSGIDSTLQKRISTYAANVSFKQIQPENSDQVKNSFLQDKVILSIHLSQLDDRFQLTVEVHTPDQEASTTRYYASAPAGVQTWAANMSLDLLLHTLHPSD